MPIIYDNINTDISRDLRFCFSNLVNQSNTGKNIKMNDLISFDVVLFNPAVSDLKEVWLQIEPGQSTKFDRIEVKIDHLPANSNINVATINTLVNIDPDDMEFYSSLAVLSLNSAQSA